MRPIQSKPIKYPAYNPNPVTFEEEVLAGVIEWYMARGLPVPQEDLDACKGLDAAAYSEFQRELQAPVATPKPAYGTPEFWKEWWAKKKAKEAQGQAPESSKTALKRKSCD